jgi:hypothetical protein
VIDGIPDGLATTQDEIQFFGLANTDDMIGCAVSLPVREVQALLDEHRREVHARYRAERGLGPYDGGCCRRRTT